MTIRSDVVSVSLLRPNRWNPNRMDKAMFQKELASIQKFGFVNPIIVRGMQVVVNGPYVAYEIIDGEHRWKAASQLGLKEVPVTIVEGLNDSDAKQLTIVLNETRGRADPERLGELLRDLLGTVERDALVEVLPIDPVAFDKLTGLADFDWDVFTQPAASKPSWVERTYRMPIDAAQVLDQALDAAKEDEGIEDWQALERIAADFVASTGVMPSRQRTGPA